MYILGQHDLGGAFCGFARAVEVTQFGDQLRDAAGTVWAVKDQYGDWVSPTLMRVGVKSNMAVVKDMSHGEAP